MPGTEARNAQQTKKSTHSTPPKPPQFKSRAPASSVTSSRRRGPRFRPDVSPALPKALSVEPFGNERLGEAFPASGTAYSRGHTPKTAYWSIHTPGPPTHLATPPGFACWDLRLLPVSAMLCFCLLFQMLICYWGARGSDFCGFKFDSSLLYATISSP